MNRTDQNYIYEFSFFDVLYESLEKFNEELVIEGYKYDKEIHQIEMQMLFEEAADATDKEAKANETILEKIGNTIAGIIKSITDFIKNITDTLFGFGKKIESDAEIVSRMVREHPELQETVAKGIQKEWFTYKDVASFEKDIIGLMNMLEKNEIDHRTFTQRVVARVKKMNEVVNPIADLGKGIATFFSSIPKAAKGVKESRDVLKDMIDFGGDMKTKMLKNNSKEGVSKARAFANALGQCTGLISKECEERVKNQGRISKYLSGFAKRHPNNIAVKYVNINKEMDELERKGMKKQAEAREEAKISNEIDKAKKAEMARQDKIRRLNEALGEENKKNLKSGKPLYYEAKPGKNK